jgi:rhodanese-related sulfurtransferase
MKRLSLGLLLAFALSVAAAGAPILGMDEVVYDFGSLSEGTIVSHTFTLTNLGDSPLVITAARATCGCTTTALSKTTLAPGESVPLEARVDTSGFGGRILKQIYVDSNDPSTPSAVLHIQGDVVPLQPYNISPSDLHYLFYLAIDVRSAEAYAAGHLLGAISIPSPTLPLWVDILPRDVILVLYDNTGAESAVQAQYLRGIGFPEARSLAGGLAAWSLTPNAASYMVGSPPDVAAPAQSALQPYEMPNGDLRSIYLIVIDLRSAAEYATGRALEGHFMGALNIATADLARWQSLLPKDAEIVLYDQTGQDSDRQAQMLQSAGFTKAYSLAGGIDAWRRAYGIEFLIRERLGRE